MRNSIRMLTIATLLTIGLASYGVAQMMSGDHGHSKMNQADSKSQSGMMSGGMMDGMSQNCKMMINDFDKIQKHFDNMLQLNDMNSIKAEMKVHQEMMQEMRDNLSQHQTMCMNMMNSDGKMDNMGKMGCGMMNKGNMNSGN